MLKQVENGQRPTVGTRLMMGASVATLAAGLFVATAVIGYFDLGAVLAALRPIGVAGFLIVVLSQLALGLPLGLAWWTVAPRQPLLLNLMNAGSGIFTCAVAALCRRALLQHLQHRPVPTLRRCRTALLLRALISS